MTGTLASAVIPAGGESRRMGRDKALVELEGRPLLVRVIDAVLPSCDEVLVVGGDGAAYARILSEHGWERTAAEGGGAPPSLRRHEARVRLLPDRRPGEGPLAGIEAGLAAARHGACLVVACDFPFLTPRVPAGLLGELARWGRDDVSEGSGGGAAAGGCVRPATGASPEERTGGERPPRAVVPVAGGRRQPLCSAVDRAAGAVATACLDEGRRSALGWLERLDVREVRPERLAAGEREAPVRERWFLDVDTSEALREARRLAARPDSVPGTGGEDR